MQALLDVSPRIREALARTRPVVALESTVIAHGLPHPHNLKTAAAMEDAVRSRGAEPATIAIIDGRIRIGIEAPEVERVATAGHVLKVSRNNLAAAIAGRGIGATTVAGTMICAHAAGIRVMGTGGIGGVHFGAAETCDVSADLRELARTPVAVVCSGAKTILDLPKTLEVLETEGVPVLGYGTDTFPGFYIRDTGLRGVHRIETPEAAAELIAAQAALGLGTGIVVANPVPEEAALGVDAVDRWIETALADAGADGVTGKDVTPFLLRRLFALSGGRTLAANIALLVENAGLAARIAGALASRHGDAA